MDHQRSRDLMSLPVLRASDREGKHQEVRGQKWHQRCDSKIEEVWMCCDGRNQRNGKFWVLRQRRKMLKFYPQSSDCTAPTRLKNTGEFSVSMELEVCSM